MWALRVKESEERGKQGSNYKGYEKCYPQVCWQRSPENVSLKEHTQIDSMCDYPILSLLF